MFKNSYRVVQDTCWGFESQVKFWWFPVRWFSLSETGRGLGFNTHLSLSSAEKLCRVHAGKGAIYKVEV